MVQSLLNIEIQIVEQRELLNGANGEFAHILNEQKLNGKFAEATGKLVNKLPSPVVKFLNKMGEGKVNTFLTYGLIAIDTGAFRKLFDLVVSGESQASINVYGRENVEEIVSKCEDMGIFVEKEFEGNYLYD